LDTVVSGLAGAVVPGGRGLQWLAYRAFVDGSVRAGGMAAAVAWVQGGRAGPVTDRDEKPVTRELAVAEMWAAVAVADGGTPPPLEVICEQFGVAYWAPLAVDRLWADGVWRALRWLTGTQAEPPMQVPVRHVDGSTPSAEELYGLALAAAPHRSWPIEERRALWDRVERNARRYRELAELVADTQRRLGVGAS
jgi:hypothetical protein